MKKTALRATAAALALLLLLPTLFACSDGKQAEDKLQILCVQFAEYDWAKNVVGASGGAQVSLLISNGTDLHSYQPTAADIIKISECDLLIYTGGADSWVTDTLKTVKNSSLRVLNTTEAEGVTLHSISSSSEEHDHHEHEHHHDIDEHIWLSLKNAAAVTAAIGAELSALDSQNAPAYAANSAAYIEQLLTLDAEFAVDAASVAQQDRFLLFADRFPFVYLLYDYVIGYKAPFEGCSTDANADFGTVLELIKSADAHGCRYIAVTEGGDPSLAQTVAQSLKTERPQIISLHSMQSVGRRDIEAGFSYLGCMKKNLNTLRGALGIDTEY